MEEIQFLFRWFHILAGVAWVGLLYYFNLVQIPSFPDFDAPARNTAIAKLVPRALWWFRWSAMVTFVTGVLLVGTLIHGAGSLDAFYSQGQAWRITLGGLLGSIMWYNVWFVIWPNQKVVIANAEGVLAGNPANPAAAGHARRAFLASRTNAVLSIPMLFFMAASSHLATLATNVTQMGQIGSAVAWLVLLGGLEANALLADKGATTKPLETVRGAAHLGVGLVVIFYVLFKVLM
ncbi:MAG: hypothetical protein EXR79_06245 [Myxococcales bacterium]|nr:hypothetical protein [Myxococcales bacterium]